MSTTIFNSLSNTGTTNTILQILRFAGLTDLLNGRGQYTFFVPNDAALTSSMLTLISDLPRLRSILQYHIVNGRYPLSTLLTMNGKTLSTLNGQPINISVSSGQVQLNGTTSIVTPDIPGSNGVIHIINGLLLPPNISTSNSNTPNLNSQPNLSWLWWLLLLILLIVIIYFLVNT